MSNTTIPTDQDLLETADAAAELGLTVRSFTVARSAGSLHIDPAARWGARNYYRRGDLQAAADRRSQARQSGPCRIPGCPLTGHQGHGYLCTEHAARVAAGEPLEALHGRPSPAVPRSLDRAARFDRKIRRGAGDECDQWLRGVSSNGYGNACDHGVMRQAHIVAFELVTGGPVPAGMELDHECGNRLCVRISPGHVVEVTHAENMRRMAERIRAQKAAAAASASRRSVPVDALLTLAVERPDATLVELWDALTGLPEAA